ncbi:WGR domain-containing protein [Nostoc sp. FACHB-973]|nr:WGR domain-containing protein [Nostoc sp. FACHB-973]
MEIYLVYVDAIQNSNKFWSGKVEGNSLTVEWGRVGYKSQAKVHECSSNSAAVKKFYNLVAEKKGKGYRESQPQIDSSCSHYEIERAIQLLNALRS